MPLDPPTVFQTGQITAGHAVKWTADGVIADAGFISTPSTSSGGAYVNVDDFGAVGDDFTDDSDALQAAIDFAYANSRSTIQLTDGKCYRVTKTIWLDPPGNMRVTGPANPTMYQFTLALVGNEANGNGITPNIGCATIRSDNGSFEVNNSYPVLVVGPGQGMRVAGINIANIGGSLWTTSFGNSIALAISGGDGGASRTMIERVFVQNFNTGFVTGWNRDSLSDANTFFKCEAHFCRQGYVFGATQNFINELISCNATYCTIAVYSPVGKAVNIYGGNYSAPGLFAQDYTVGSTSALSSVTVSGGAGTYLGRFTTVVTIPAGPFEENVFTDGGTCAFTRFVFETAKYGLIPCTFVSYNAGTNTITLQFDDDWVYSQWGFAPDFTTTDIQAQLQAVTTMMAANGTTNFYGQGIKVYGVHIENAATVTTVLDASSSSNGAAYCDLQNVYSNVDLALPNGFPFGGSKEKIQSVTPTVKAISAAVYMRTSFEGYNISLYPVIFVSKNNSPLFVEGCDNLINVNIWNAQNNKVLDGFESTNITRGQGNTRFNRWPFLQKRQFGNNASDVWPRGDRGGIEFWGWVPAPGRFAEVTPRQFSDMSASPITAAKGSYPLMYGKALYRVTTVTPGISAGFPTLNHCQFVYSNHDGWSWGQNFSVNWSYRGQSTCLYLDDLTYVFPGLKIGIDNGGGTVWYIITQVNAVGGYVTVAQYTNSDQPVPLAGTKTVNYSGGTIFQEAYSLVQTSPDLYQPLVALTDAATVAVDLSTGLNFACTLNGNRTLGNPTNPTVGQRGTMVMTQGAGGSHALAYSGNYKFVGGVAPVLTTTAGAEDYLDYFVETSTRIFISARLDVK